MTPLFTQEELLADLPGLTAEGLAALVRHGIVRPVQADTGARFREIDRARLHLALDLQDAYEIHQDALTLILSLLDEVNGLRGEMRSLLGAVAAEPPETRARMRAVIRDTRIILR